MEFDAARGGELVIELGLNQYVAEAEARSEVVVTEFVITQAAQEQWGAAQANQLAFELGFVALEHVSNASGVEFDANHRGDLERVEFSVGEHGHLLPNQTGDASRRAVPELCQRFVTAP